MFHQHLILMGYVEQDEGNRVNVDNVEMTAAESSTNQLQKLLFESRRRFLRKYRNYHLEMEDYNRATVVSRFCDSGSNLNILEPRGIACIPFVFWNPTLIQFFLDKGRNVNAQDEQGRTALNLAANFGLTRAIEFLLSKGADPNVCDNEGNNAFLSLVKTELQEQWADKESARPIAQLLIEHGVDVNATNADMESVLHYAGEVPNCLELLDDKCTASAVDARSAKYLYEITPLMNASLCRSVDTCKLLLAKGADVNATDLNGWTALHHAINRNGNEGCVSALLVAGADPNIRCLSGRDVYEMSCLLGSMITSPTDTEKLTQIHEFFGALKIVKKADYEGGIDLWKIALSELGQSKSEELQENCKLAKEWKSGNKEIEDKLFKASLDTIVRISQGASKLWNILSCASACKFNKVGQCILDYALSNLVPESSINSFDLDTMGSLLDMFRLQQQLITQPHAVWILNLSVLCLEKICSATNNNIVQRFSICDIRTEACDLAMTLLCLPENQISAQRRNECMQLLKTIIGLDPRDSEGNSILHTVCNSFASFRFKEKEIDTLISLGASIGATNNLGYTPMQMMSCYDRAGARAIHKKLVNCGAHIDARNSDNQACLLDAISISQSFASVTLQCLCAKVLTTRRVEYRNAVLPCGWKVPASIVEFIDSYVYSGWNLDDADSSDEDEIDDEDDAEFDEEVSDFDFDEEDFDFDEEDEEEMEEEDDDDDETDGD